MADIRNVCSSFVGKLHLADGICENNMEKQAVKRIRGKQNCIG
jgi:3-oxoacyl-[acyl-carrier-protein] synthase III